MAICMDFILEICIFYITNDNLVFSTVGETNDGPTEAPRLEICFDVTTLTFDLGHRILWRIGCKGVCRGCASDQTFSSNSRYTQQCCMLQDETEFTITCISQTKNGWHKGLLIINGTIYCSDFLNGQEYQETMFKELGTGTGRFEIFELSYNESGKLESLAVDFEQSCELTNPTLKGQFRYNSNRPLNPQ